METQTRLSHHNKFISVENIITILSVLAYIYVHIYVHIKHICLIIPHTLLKYINK